MCGIAGMASAAGDGADLDVVRRMTQAIAHRGPDGDGHWRSENGRVALGHRRLSIIDLSSAGAQPMASASGRFVISFNGEIYNFRELRQELALLGSQFAGHSDTEVIVAGCEIWGAHETVRRLAGMFAIAIWDNAENSLFLVRDRVGIKPLYYALHGSRLLFASELRPIVIAMGSLPEISSAALGHYLRLGYVPAPYSIFEGVQKLPPGTSITFAGGAISGPEAYWSVEEIARAGLATPLEGDADAILRQIEDKLLHVVDQHMISDVPLGAFLSGGVDSSLVTGVMQTLSGRPVKTFSIGFEDRAYDEAGYAADVARHLGTDHTQLYVTDADARGVIDMLPDIYDEPFADLSQIPTYLVSHLARQSVTVSLSGDGGDELFGGYNRYVFVSRYWERLSRMPGGLRAMAGKLMTSLPVEGWDRFFERLGPVMPGRLRMALPGQKIHKAASVVGAADLRALHSRLISQWSDPQLLLAPGSAQPAELFGSHDDLPAAARQMLWDMQVYLVDDILTKVDRASMKVALEARVPLLDHRFIELAWQVPLSLKIKDGEGKWILKKLLSKYVPEHLFNRPKMGFGVPVDAWLRGSLRDWAGDLIGSGDSGLIHSRAVEATWRAHLDGAADRGGALWTFIMFNLWYERAKQWV